MTEDYEEFLKLSKSWMDEDVETFTPESVSPSTSTPLEVLGLIAVLVLHLASVLFALILLYVMIKFKLYKKNVLVLNFCLGQVLLNKMGAITAIISLLGWQYEISLDIYLLCLLIRLNFWLGNLCLFSMWSTGCLWFLEIIKPKLCQKYPKIPLYVLGLIHLGGATEMIVSLILWYQKESFETSPAAHVLTLFYFVALFVIIAINIATYFKPLNNSQLATKYHLVVATYVLFSYLSAELILLWDMLSVLPYTSSLFRLVHFVSGSMIILSTVGVVVLLGIYCPDFKMAYSLIFKRSLRQDPSRHLDEYQR